MLNVEELKTLAVKYESTPSAHCDRETKRVYALFLDECFAQFQRIPVKVIFTADDPYMKSRDMFEDIDNGFMRVYTKGETHPLMNERENSIFRAVHDYFGHYLTRGNFKPEGEVKAWENHRRMFSPEASRALDTETIYQVATYFYGSKPNTYATQKAILF